MRTSTLVPCLVPVLAATLSASVVAQAYRVGTPFEPRVTFGRVYACVLSPDGEWAAYVGDQRFSHVRELYVAPADGSGTARRASPDLVQSGDVRIGAAGEPLGIEFSPDGEHVVFLADAAVDERLELYCASAQAPGATIRLSPVLAQFQSVQPGFRLTAERAVFQVEWTNDIDSFLWSAALDGSEPPRRLDFGLPANDVIRGFDVSPDGTCVAIFTNSGLYRSPTDGATPAVALATTVTPQESIFEARFSPDGARVVFRWFHYPVPSETLNSVPTAGGAVTHLASGTVDFAIAHDSSSVVYRWGGDTMKRLFRVPVGGGSRTELSVSNGHVVEWALVPGSVVFVGWQEQSESNELFAASFSGGGAVRIGLALPSDQYVLDFAVDRSGELVLHRSGTNASHRLLAARTDGAGEPVELAVQAEAGYAFTADGTCALYRAAGALQARPVDASASATRLDVDQAPAPTLSFAAAGERALFRSQTGAPAGAPIDLWSVRLDGSEDARISRPMPSVSLATVQRFLPTADGKRCVYVADAAEDDVFELWSSGTRPLSASTLLSGLAHAGADVQTDLALTPDGGRVVYRADTGVDERFELFVAPLDGSAPPLALVPGLGADRDVEPGPLVDAAGARAVFRADLVTDGVAALYSVALDGSSAPLRLDAASGTGVAPSLRLAGARVLYLARRGLTTRYDLYSVPVDGSEPATRVNGAPVTGGGLLPNDEHLWLSEDGAWVLFRSAQVTPARFDVYVAPADASAAARRVHDAILSSELVTTFRFAAGGARVLYQVDAADSHRLYSVPSDGSASPVLLATNATSSTSPLAVGSLVVFRRDASLAIVAADGASAPVELTASLPDLREFAASPDGAWVVYACGYPSSGISRIERVSADAASRGVVAGPFAGNDQALADFRVTPDGGRVLYKAVIGGRTALWSRPLSVDAPAELVGDGLYALADSRSFEVTSDSRLVLFQRGTEFQTYDLFAGYVDPARVREGRR